MFIASLLSLFLLFVSIIYICTYICTYMYVHLYAVTGFMFVLPGLTLKIVPLTNSLCYYCHIALLFFCCACCCWCCYYWCCCFFVCFALVVHPPVAKAAILAMLLAKNTHTLSRRHNRHTQTLVHGLLLF